MKLSISHKHLFIALGFVSLAIGIVGIFLPLLPTTPLVLLAAFFFSKGSPRLQAWLHQHPRFGPAIREWQEDRVIRPRAKVLAVIAITISFCVPLFVMNLPLWARLLVAVVGLSLIGFIVSRRNRPLA